MAINLICKIFGHNYGEWEYKKHDTCEQARICKRDDHKQERVEPHQFTEWEYVAEDSCQRERRCKRDSFIERGDLLHQFNDWEYVSNSSCEQVRVCKRDGYIEKREAHEWIVLDYTEDTQSNKSHGSYYDTHRLHTITVDWSQTLKCARCPEERHQSGSNTTEYED